VTPGQPAPPRPGTLGVWWAAIRPRTLGMALAPVALGTALAIADGVELAWAVLFATAACALLIQIGTNLYNDAIDFERGTDRPERLGPLRVTLAGWASAAEVKRGALLCLLLALLLGAWLCVVGGGLILAIGLASLVAGWAYSGGPRPISHSPFGELFVLLFFGVFAVLGSHSLQSRWVRPPPRCCWSTTIATSPATCAPGVAPSPRCSARRARAAPSRCWCCCPSRR